MSRFLLGCVVGPLVIAYVVINWGDELLRWAEQRS